MTTKQEILEYKASKFDELDQQREIKCPVHKLKRQCRIPEYTGCQECGRKPCIVKLVIWTSNWNERCGTRWNNWNERNG